MTLIIEHPLLATECTEFDTGAERVAFALAQHLGVPLDAIIPTASNAEYEVADPDYASRVDASTAAGVNLLKERASRLGVGFDVRIGRGDDRAAAIAAEATARHSDLLVLRRRGKRGFLARLFVGEMVRAAVTAAPCSALLVPRACEIWQRRILAVIDGTPAAPSVVTLAARLAEAFRLPLVVANGATAQPGEAQAIATLGTLARDHAITLDHRALPQPTAAAIVGLATSLGADLIIVNRDGAPTDPRAPFGPLARDVVGQASCPVLLVRHPGTS